MTSSTQQPDPNGGASKAVGLGVLVAIGLAGLLIAAYVIGYNRANTGETAKSPESTKTTSTQTTKKPDAKALFVEKCGSCHVLEAAGTTGTSGPNLDQLKRPADVVEKQIIDGGATMPAGLVPDSEAKEVADYVAKSTGS